MFFKFARLIRFNNWIKNTFIFIPLFFSGQILDYTKFFNTTIIVFCFSLVTSFVYIINDICDFDYDQNHPIKKKRPIANRDISFRNAFIIEFFLRLFYLALFLCSFVLSIIYIFKNFLNDYFPSLIFSFLFTVLITAGLFQSEPRHTTLLFPMIIIASINLLQNYLVVKS